MKEVTLSDDSITLIKAMFRDIRCEGCPFGRETPVVAQSCYCFGDTNYCEQLKRELEI